MATKRVHAAYFLVLEKKLRDGSYAAAGELGPFGDRALAAGQKRLLTPQVPKTVRIRIEGRGAPKKPRVPRENPRVLGSFVAVVEVAKKVQPNVEALMKRALKLATDTGIKGTRELAAIVEKASGQKPTPAQLQRLLDAIGA